MNFMIDLIASIENFYDPKEGKKKFVFHILLTLMIIFLIFGIFSSRMKQQKTVQQYKDSYMFKDNDQKVIKNDQKEQELSKKVNENKATQKEKKQYYIIWAGKEPDLTYQQPPASTMNVLDKMDNDVNDDNEVVNELSNMTILIGGQTKWLYENWLLKSFDITNGKIGFDPYSATMYIGTNLSEKGKDYIKKRANEIWSISELSSRAGNIKFVWYDEMKQ